MSIQDAEAVTVTSADGGTLAIRRDGAGPALVVLHGSGGGLDSWAAVTAPLTSSYAVWRVARRGFGPSDPRPGGTSFAVETEDVRRLLIAAGAGTAPVHLAGMSYGAILALHTAAAHPALVASLALFEPPLLVAGPHLRPVLAEYRTLVAAGDLRAATLLFAREAARVPAPILDALAAAPPPAPAEAARKATGDGHDLESLAADVPDVERWASVAVPTLLMAGADSWSPLPEGMAALAAALPHAERVVWEGQAHFASVTGTALMTAAMAGFLDRHREG